MHLAATATDDVLIPAGPDLVALPVKVAFIAADEHREPAAEEYHTAGWEGSFIVITVGPGSTVGALAPAVYDIWVRITDTPPRTPTERVGTLTIGPGL
ncbi:hypothetical protein Aph01nite_73890 [Acrocarpospora phusangensis]|uniref:Uncharacterized protein n=2 Tax=Acrocarpospora phusangensis TaxID=1070424 RepID=A0A919QJ91_9ACTN|nr:hypothetical protein Aph01nite_73890 [Acrocarpospora phusangensis]